MRRMQETKALTKLDYLRLIQNRHTLSARVDYTGKQRACKLLEEYRNKESRKSEYLHEKIWEKTLIIACGSNGRRQMLQASGLEPPCHDCISCVICRSRIVERAIVKRRRSRSIALLHMAAHVALRSSLRSQLRRSVKQLFIQTNTKIPYMLPKRFLLGTRNQNPRFQL